MDGRALPFLAVSDFPAQRTLIEAARERIEPILARAYGGEDARRWFGRWRLFYLACAELFSWAGGSEWYVAHYRLGR